MARRRRGGAAARRRRRRRRRGACDRGTATRQRAGHGERHEEWLQSHFTSFASTASNRPPGRCEFRRKRVKVSAQSKVPRSTKPKTSLPPGATRRLFSQTANSTLHTLAACPSGRNRPTTPSTTGGSRRPDDPAASRSARCHPELSATATEHKNQAALDDDHAPSAVVRQRTATGGSTRDRGDAIAGPAS